VLTPVLVAALVGASCTSSDDGGSASPGSTTPSGLLDAPVSPVPPLLDEADVQAAVDQLDGIVADAMERTGVPGIAVGVVYQDEVVFTKGYGVREVGTSDPVDAETVFQVASVSKPVASTVVAGVVGDGAATWTDPVRTWNPDFAYSDPYVTANATLSDLLSHRSGLPGGSGDLLEDLGWDREYILGVLDQQPLRPFRSTYSYANFGITEGGVAAADAVGTDWESLAEERLFEPLGMESSSYRHADYEARANKALIHVREGDGPDATWSAANVRDADAEAPAGGLSTSVDDMTKFLRLQLGEGAYDGTQVIDADALQVTHVPHQELSQPTDPATRTQFYGLCWNVTTDDQGRVRLDHSGAFATGASTNVMMLPGEELGIVTLTNGQPLGMPEAINDAFLDAAQHGAPTVDWVGYWLTTWESIYEEMAEPSEQWRTPPASPAPSADLAAYEGTYQNSYYGPLTVTAAGGQLSMSMGPADRPTSFPLTPFDGDTFTFETIGENANGPSGAVFALGPDGRAATVELAFYDPTGLGTFTRG
jgi:CubicO group peptidase (beta-lactamase class C family)